MATLAEVRARIAASQEGKSNFKYDNQIFAHWNMKEGDSSLVRFLPDADTNNVFFWVERNMIKLPFAGVVGDTNAGPCTVQVPCVEMYNDNSICPILSEVRPWFKDKSLEDMGRKYWKKRSYIFQGFVVEDGLNEDETPENPIRRFIMGPQIFQLIKSSIMDPELEELPTDTLRGLDFRINKTNKGGYADYSTSKWSRNERALSEEEQRIIQQHGLYTLADFLPNKPTEYELKIIKEMFEASVDGEAYDPEKWGQYYRPAGMHKSEETSTPKVKEEAAQVEEVEEVEEVKKDVAVSNDGRAQDILAMIRNRQAK